LVLAVVVLAGLYASCDRFGSGVRVYTEEPFPEKLSAWRLFQTGGTNADAKHPVDAKHPLKPNQGVVPYDLNTPLFSDYADKYRFVWMPAGASATYDAEEAFNFPAGTIIAKTFAFPDSNSSGRARLIETRLLVHTKTGWIGLPYIWNEDQTEATLAVAGGTTEVETKDHAGSIQRISYNIPNTNECAQCHDRAKTLLPIGPKARQLNRDYDYADGRSNQLAYWTKIGYLRGAPVANEAPRAAVWNDPQTGSLEARARSYLDSNCAHCHQPGGSAGYTGFLLGWKERDPRRLGYCKNPNSAGFSGDLSYDVVPGRPDESILLYRMMSRRPKEMMPEIGRSLVHGEAVALVREWLATLDGNCSGPETVAASH
jgi:uncharacterized repeat protein (TIGR03806 family)